ncbi:MAG: hypothetical protein AB7V58_11035 [Solirubrobacterales bacterium]
MSGRRTAIATALLCALAISAIAASSASAGGNIYTCVKVEEGAEFDDQHCTSKVGVLEYKHELIEGWTWVRQTNANTASETTAAQVVKLLGALSGVVTEVQCTTAEGEGEIGNEGTSASGTGTVEYTGCTVTKPAGKGCKVSGGEITTNLLALTTAGQTGTNVKISPNSGTEFASVKIESCSVPALNNTFPVTGSLIATANGAVLSTTHSGITSQNTLKFGGVKAGIEAAGTMYMFNFFEPNRAISVTP